MVKVLFFLRFLFIGFFILTGSFTFYGCNSNNSEIDKLTTGEVSTIVQPYIIFKDNIVDSSNIGVFHAESFRLNNEEISARYNFINNNKMVIYFPKPLHSNTPYTLEVPMEKIAKDMKVQVKSKTIILKFKTAPTSIEVENLTFSNASPKSVKLNATIALSQTIDLNTLTKATKVQSDDGKNIPFKITEDSNSMGFALMTNEISKPKEKDINFTISFDSKMLGLRDDVKFSIPLVTESNFIVQDVKAKPGEFPSINISFSQELLKNINLKDYIKVSPAIDFSVAQAGNTIYLTGAFNTETNYSVSILKGLKSQNNKTLQETYETSIKIKDIPPSIVFSSTGVFLPQSANKKVAFKTMNVKKVQAKVTRIYPNNITQFLYDDNFVGATNNTSRSIYYNIYRIGDEVFKKDFDIENTKNTWIQNELDLSGLKDSKGVFIVELSYQKKDVAGSATNSSGEEDDYYDNVNRIGKHLVFSNIALIAQQGNDTITASALNITTNAPMNGVKISAINRKNQIVAQATTNASGDAILNLKKQEVLYLLAESQGDATLLKLSSTNVSTDGFDVGGSTFQNGIKTFIYTERGVYRPGDNLHLNAIIRNNDSPLLIDHPIYLTLTSPRGKKMLDEYTLHQISDGVYYYQFNIPKDADTGVWTAKINVGGNSFYKNFSVETIVPDRIKVAIKAEETLDIKQNKKLQFSLQGDYLFGAPASDLEYSTEMYIQKQEFHSKTYKNYIFDNASSMNYSYNDIVKGKLDSNGFTQKSFDLNNIAQINTNLRATLVAKVSEKSSRSVTTHKSILLKQYDSFVGIGRPNSTYISTKQEISLPIISIVSDDSKLLSGRKLSYKIYRNSYSWWWDYDYGSSRSIKTDSNTEVIAEGTIISQDKPVFLKHTFQERGDILIEVTDVENGSTSSISLYASEWGDPLNAKKVTALKIWSDKTEYSDRQHAKISFEGTDNAKALITLNKDGKILKRFWRNVQKGVNSFDIPIDSQLAPNAYVSVSLLQDYNTTDNDLSLRLFGVVPIMVKDSKSILTLELDAPQEVLPNSDFEVKISNAEKKQATFTLAIVDEGLLGLTDFKTPDPWDYFYAKLSLALKTFDTYDLIISKTFGKVHNILKAGGDGGDEEMSATNAKQKRDENAERFKPVVLYTAPVSTDSHGNATLKFKMPSYIGSVRVMAVASNATSIGSAQKNITVSAPVVMMPTLPRSLKVGDKFSLPIELFPTKNDIKNATIKLTAQKGLVKLNTNQVEVKFKDKTSQTIIIEGQVTNAMGVEKIDIALQTKGFNMTDSTEIDIKAINPYITSVQKQILAPNKTIQINAPKDFVIGSNKGFLNISGSPIISIDHRVRWLIHYPYGCAEQTTSSVLPQLFLDKISHAKFIDKEEIANNINAGIRRLQSFQVANGGLAYWQGDRKADVWGSNYAGHFLLLAQQNGYFVPHEFLRKWINYQINYTKSVDSVNSAQIYSLYLLALAKEAQIGVMNAIYEDNLSKLSVTDKWLLGATYKLAGKEDIAKKITNNLGITPDGSKEYYSYSYGSKLRDEAIILSAYHTIYGTTHEALLNSIATALESEAWYSTQTLGYSLMALGEIKRDSQDMQIAGLIDINKQKQEFDSMTNSLQFVLNSGNATITSKSQKDLFIGYVWEGVPLDPMPEVAKNIRITQEFLDNEGKSIDISNLTSGTSFWIRLTLSKVDQPVNVSNVAITQGLPSGWEIENLRLNNDSLPSFIVQQQINNIAYTDIRDDKIMWFFDFYDNSQNNSNVQQAYVKINVITPGEYTLPPAYAEAMYDNNYQANTKAIKIKVKAK